MSATVVSKILFTVTFPLDNGRRAHISSVKLHSLARKQMTDLEIIDTIEHLLKCHRCLENYRFIRQSYLSECST